MAAFSLQFFVCNLFTAAMIGTILLSKRLLKRVLSPRMQYNLWLIMLALLAVPFLPVRLSGAGTFSVLSWLYRLKSGPENAYVPPAKAAGESGISDGNWLYDFTTVTGENASTGAESLLFAVWIAGMIVMTALVIRAAIRLYRLKKSALPVQNRRVRVLYQRCLVEMGIKKDIPIYSTAFLKSPIIAGYWKPCICLPIRLISECREDDLRYMLLHELQHYKYKDNLLSIFMNLAGIAYWFNPLVWYALREMRNDREVACDTSVLMILKDGEYVDYGSTLLDFAEKLSLTTFPVAAGMGGSMKQMRRRILNIVSYETPSVRRKLKGFAAYGAVTLLLASFIPALSIRAEEGSYYHFSPSGENIRYEDFSDCFRGYQGSFVFYDETAGSWTIYDKDYAARRTSPNSTYKIYDALMGLENGIITPQQSKIAWDGTEYSLKTWNSSQDLCSAMKNSVNWYFQSIDEQAGLKAAGEFIRKIGYGNENLSGDSPSYWMGSDLKISPIEQVELLRKFNRNEFQFAPDHVQAVKESILLSATSEGSLYGKTGTGCTDGCDSNGWFIGYVEHSGRAYYFAVNIQGEKNANGASAAEIAMSVLAEQNVWNGTL